MSGELQRADDDKAPEQTITPEWTAEIAKRLTEMEDGTVDRVPADEVRRRIQERRKTDVKE